MSNRIVKDKKNKQRGKTEERGFYNFIKVLYFCAVKGENRERQNGWGLKCGQVQGAEPNSPMKF